MYNVGELRKRLTSHERPLIIAERWRLSGVQYALPHVARVALEHVSHDVSVLNRMAPSFIVIDTSERVPAHVQKALLAYIRNNPNVEVHYREDSPKPPRIYFTYRSNTKERK